MRSAANRNMRLRAPSINHFSQYPSRAFLAAYSSRRMTFANLRLRASISAIDVPNASFRFPPLTPPPTHVLAIFLRNHSRFSIIIDVLKNPHTRRRRIPSFLSLFFMRTILVLFSKINVLLPIFPNKDKNIKIKVLTSRYVITLKHNTIRISKVKYAPRLQRN